MTEELLKSISYSKSFDFILEAGKLSANGQTVSNPNVAVVFGKIVKYYKSSTEKICRASLSTLASSTGLSTKTVERAIKVLEKIGLVQDVTPPDRKKLDKLPREYIVKERRVVALHWSWVRGKKKEKENSLPEEELPAKKEKTSSILGIARPDKRVDTSSEDFDEEIENF